MANLCVSVRSFRRARYLKECLDSLLSNKEAEDIDFYFLQNGAVNPFSGIRRAEDEEIEASLKVFQESKLSNKTIYVSDHDMGSQRQKYHQLTTLFPKYNYVVLIDNDLIFNKYYIKTLKVLFKQFKDDPSAGMIQTSFRHDGHNFQSKEQAEVLEDAVAYGFSHRWEQGFWRESWEKIKPFMEDYFELTKKCDFQELFNNNRSYIDIRGKLIKLYGHVACDYCLEESAKRAGYKGIHTLTLRHKTIGRDGILSFRANRFDAGRYGKIELHQVGNRERYRLV